MLCTSCSTTVRDAQGKRVGLTLHDVLIVPQLGRNLQSVHQIAAKGGAVSFDRDRCTIVVQGRTIVVPAVGKLYQLQLDSKKASEAQLA